MSLVLDFGFVFCLFVCFCITCDLNRISVLRLKSETLVLVKDKVTHCHKNRGRSTIQDKPDSNKSA